MEKVLDPLIDDIRVLETEGIEVDWKIFFGSVLYLSGDNLGSHSLGGFTECFSGENQRICRFCNATKLAIQTQFDVNSFIVRSEEQYNQHVEMVCNRAEFGKIYGVFLDSPLNKIHYHHATRGLPPDAMHDKLEGVVPYELALILSKFM